MLKLTYQLDCADFVLKKGYLEQSINRWNEVNQYSSTDHADVHKYLIQDSNEFETFSKEFASYYSNPDSYYFISIYKSNERVKGIYFPFKKETCPIQIVLI